MCALVLCHALLTLALAGAMAEFELGLPVNPGAAINTAAEEGSPDVSADGLEMYFHSSRPGGSGGVESSRAFAQSAWSEVTPFVEAFTRSCN